MLEQIFGSKTRVQIFTLFIRNPDKSFYVREIARITGQYINAIRRELGNLERFGFLRAKSQFKKKYYGIDQSFFLLEEIKRLFLKSKVFLENDLTTALKQVGDVKLLVFTGQFTGAPTRVDLLIVGDKVKVPELRKILENFSTSAGQDIKYTLFDSSEYHYRQEIADHFLEETFSNKNIILLDKINIS